MESRHTRSAYVSQTSKARFVRVRALHPGTNRNRFPSFEDEENRKTDQSNAIFPDQTSNAARLLRAEIERVARWPYNILITGETGTGKTHAAREIHKRSVRTNNPFMELNCANLPEQLVEAELFGYRKGAFTGADRDHVGLFEEANGGILFLDEIGDLPLAAQNKLLKAIDEKQIKRLGTNHYKLCDVQVIAATSRDLPHMVQTGSFREDLYCRLAVLTVETTPLRDRREDIPAMIALFLREAGEAVADRDNRNVYRIEDSAMDLLAEFHYPGNIRSLRNLVYELTSYASDNETISTSLVNSALCRLRSRESDRVSTSNSDVPRSFSDLNDPISLRDVRDFTSTQLELCLSSIVEEGDILLPLELCVLRRDETFKQWTARAKRCSIEAARQATGGSMRRVAERLGLTRCSLLGHLSRAKQTQNESLFDWERQPD